MATYSNQHWLLSHIRNSFISTDETGMCETVMTSDDLPKHFLKRFQNQATSCSQQHRKSLQEVDFICYPGLDLSDDEDLDMTAQSFDIQMYPEVAHRFRSNTAQKLEKMDIARRKAARTKTVNVDDEIVPPERSDFFVRKPVAGEKRSAREIIDEMIDEPDGAPALEEKLSAYYTSKLSMLIANSPKQTPNKFMDYARFDGTSQVGVQTKRIYVFLNMLPGKERNYPIKICVLASAKILEVIGFVCYKASMLFPDLPLKSVRHYALYMTEDNDDIDDFPPLDNREPCSKFGFSHLTLAERKSLAPTTRFEYENPHTKSFTSDEDKTRLAAEALRSLQSIDLNGGIEEDNPNCVSASSTDDHLNEYEKRMLSHNDIFEAPMYRTYRLHFIDKRVFKVVVTLGISGERLEIDQPKNSKFWQKQKQATYPIESVAFCEITERRNLKATLRIWLKASSSSAVSVTTCTGGNDKNSSSLNITGASPTSPGLYQNLSSPFGFLNTSSSGGSNQPIRFKHYDFETDIQTAEQILNKLNCILDSKNSEVRLEFLQMRERKLEKSHAKKHLKL